MPELSYRPQMRTPTPGFTLIELMVTVGVAAILLAIAAPSFSRLMSRTDATQTSNDLVGALHVARSEAASRGVTVAVTASSSGDWSDGWSVQIPAVAGSASSVAQVLQSHGALDERFTVAASGGVAAIAYTARGSVEGAAGDTTIQVCREADNEAQRVVITVRGAGTVSSHRDDSATGADC